MIRYTTAGSEGACPTAFDMGVQPTPLGARRRTTPGGKLAQCQRQLGKLRQERRAPRVRRRRARWSRVAA